MAYKAESISVKALPALQSAAVFRLILRSSIEINNIFLPFGTFMGQLIQNYTAEDGSVDAHQILSGWAKVQGEWEKCFAAYGKLIVAGRLASANIAFSGLVLTHNHFAGKVKSLTEAPTEALLKKLWEQRRAKALQAAQSRALGDSLQLSTRIWRVNHGGLAQIRAAVADSLANRTSAIKLAQRVDTLVGADTAFPRWISSRLYGMTPADRKASDRGLLRGPNGEGSGVTYTALRLARTELQYANHAVNTDIAVHSPWVTGRNTKVSLGHTGHDACDTVAAEGPYEPAQEVLPVHPNCLCYYVNVLVETATFLQLTKGWLNGENTYLDDYEQWIGYSPTNLIPWTEAEALQMWLGKDKVGQGRLLGVGTQDDEE